MVNQILIYCYLKDHTVYRDGLSINNELIINFWDVMLSFENELKQKFIDFIYDQKRLPSKQEFIRKNDDDEPFKNDEKDGK